MKQGFGLRDLPEDTRDFSLGAIDDLPAPYTLPEHFRLPFTVKHQGSTDWCSAYATCSASEVQEEIELDPAYTFSATKEIMGDPEGWGADLRSACKSHVEYGALPVSELNNPNLTDKEKRYWHNWERFLISAKFYRKKSFFKITGPYDAFNNIKLSLYKYQTPIVIGILYGYKLEDIYFDEIKKNGYGHAMTVIGYTTYDTGEPVLIVGNSYGEEAGMQGVHFITKKVINHFVDRYGAYTFIDIEKDTAKSYLAKDIKLSDKWLTKLFKWIKNMLHFN